MRQHPRFFCGVRALFARGTAGTISRNPSFITYRRFLTKYDHESETNRGAGVGRVNRGSSSQRALAPVPCLGCVVNRCCAGKETHLTLFQFDLTCDPEKVLIFVRRKAHWLSFAGGGAANDAAWQENKSGLEYLTQTGPPRSQIVTVSTARHCGYAQHEREMQVSERLFRTLRRMLPLTVQGPTGS
jgi:hypothetical protein